MRYMSSPTPSVVRNAAWPGRTPKYPWRPGTTISSAVSATTSRVGVATSSVRRSATLAGLGELLGLLHRLADVAHHVEGLLRELVVLALDDLLEALRGVGDLHVPARRARELLGDEERLREEALDLPRAGDDQLVLVRELFHAEDRDDVLEILVPLEDQLHGPRGRVVLGAEDVRVEDSGRRRERIDRWVDAQLGERPAQHRRRVEMRERGGRRGVGDVVGRHVDRLDRGDRALLRGGDALLERAHFGAERRLVADRRRHAAEERRDLGAGLREPEDVVDEQQHVLSLFVPEVFGRGQAGQGDAQPGSRRLRHLAEDERRLLDDARLLHLVVQVVALARPLADAGEHRNASVLLRDVVDQLLDEHGLADARAAEQAGLAALRVRLEQVDDLDAGLEHLDLRRLILERRRGPMDRVRLRRADRRALVHRLADDVHDAAKGLLPHRDRDRLPGILDGHAARQAVGRGHRDRSHLALAEVLRDLQRQLLRVGEDVLVLDAQDDERVVDRRQPARLELHVDDRSDDLNDLPGAHASAPSLIGSPRPRTASALTATL